MSKDDPHDELTVSYWENIVPATPAGLRAVADALEETGGKLKAIYRTTLDCTDLQVRIRMPRACCRSDAIEHFSGDQEGIQ